MDTYPVPDGLTGTSLDIPTGVEHEEGEEGKDAVGRKRPRHTQERLKVRERMKAAGRRLQSFCLSL